MENDKFFKIWFGFVAVMIVGIVLFEGFVILKVLNNLTMENILALIKAWNNN